MIDRWLQDGVIRPSKQLGETPRIVFVASESHRSSHVVDFGRLGEFTDYRMKDSLKYYGISKLLLCMYATELSRRLNPDDMVEVAVHAMCPGGIASNIARDAPVLLKALVNPLMRHFLQSPEEAVAPAIYLCCAEAAGSATGMYLHLMQEKSVLPDASDPENGSQIVGTPVQDWWRNHGSGTERRRTMPRTLAKSVNHLWRLCARKPMAERVDMAGRSVIVTGASPGSIGYETARILASWGARVVANRSAQRGIYGESSQG